MMKGSSSCACRIGFDLEIDRLKVNVYCTYLQTIKVLNAKGFALQVAANSWLY